LLGEQRAHYVAGSTIKRAQLRGRGFYKKGVAVGIDNLNIRDDDGGTRGGDDGGIGGFLGWAGLDGPFLLLGWPIQINPTSSG